MEAVFRVYIWGPILNYLRQRKIKKLREDITLYGWAYGNRVPDAASKIFDNKVKSLKLELTKLLLEECK
jgi:hypothetical protein